MESVLGQYYEGITRRLRAEVDVINALFSHQGEKGGGNEDALRGIVRSFVPERFGIGTGFVIDKNGTPSKQSDIVIYERQQYPAIFSLTSLHMFPVDIVVATIEVKTTLDSSKASEAIANIASVKDLELLDEYWKTFSIEASERLFQTGQLADEDVLFTTHSPTPPLGYVFAYNSEAVKFETFSEWFSVGGHGPEMAVCMDQGVVSRRHGKFVAQCFPVSGKDIRGAPTKKVGGEEVEIDQGRVLLAFLLSLQNDLVVKKIHPEIRFARHYPIPQLLQCKTVIDRKLQ